MMSPEEFSRKSKILQIASFSLAENMRAGNFRSLFKGQGIEFSDVREYAVGDNVRAIDWNVSARMGRAFVKQYEEDRELSVFFVLDCSLSMSRKIGAMGEIASLLLFASERNSAAIGAVLFDGEIRSSFATKSGRDHSRMILSKVWSLGETPASRGSALSSALKGASSLLRRRSLVFVVSDFRVGKWRKELALLSERNDVVAIRVVDDCDSELPDLGFSHFRDFESGETVRIPTFSKSFRRFWFDRNRSRTDAWESFCRKHGAFPLCVNTKDDVPLVLSRFFRLRRR